MHACCDARINYDRALPQPIMGSRKNVQREGTSQTKLPTGKRLFDSIRNTEYLYIPLQTISKVLRGQSDSTEKVTSRRDIILPAEVFYGCHAWCIDCDFGGFVVFNNDPTTSNSVEDLEGNYF